ncbi:unnamed protein product [Blepharisma stoltei]|uniref:Kinesin-like protein n=1 Tax=Blepharisma stoltei TaxID=1481888 RepID=A0AAU9ITV0_9CILI|nr:unnamed protein product [Blepharisma stoltei]
MSMRRQGSSRPADPNSQGNVIVACRFRPLNEKEKEFSMDSVAEFLPDGKTVVINQKYENFGTLKFSFDYVFPPDTEQSTVYDCSGIKIVESVMQGFNGTIFAYGQTSSGKTYTMNGPDVDNIQLMGIIPRMIYTVFNKIENSEEHIEFSVKVGYCEIYLERIKDLLDPSKDNLKIHEDKARGVYISGLSTHYVSNNVEVLDLMKIGLKNREVGHTNMNSESSRSHSIFIMTIQQTNTLDLSSKTGKMYIVDLAGSEKVSKTGAEGKRLSEAKNINKSLTTLGMVITSLIEGNSHIPYRDSKLTRVLQDSLGGNSKTSLIITCSPSPYNESETVSTLRFGIMAKSIKNKPKINREYTVSELKLMLQKAQQEIEKKDKRIEQLEKIISQQGISLPSDTLDITKTTNESDSEEDEIKDKEDSKGGEYMEVIHELEETRTKLSKELENNFKLKSSVDELTKAYEIFVENVEEMYREIHKEAHVKNPSEILENLQAAKRTLEQQAAMREKMKFDLEIKFDSNWQKLNQIEGYENELETFGECKRQIDVLERQYRNFLDRCSLINENKKDEKNFNQNFMFKWRRKSRNKEYEKIVEDEEEKVTDDLEPSSPPPEIFEPKQSGVIKKTIKGGTGFFTRIPQLKDSSFFSNILMNIHTKKFNTNR